MSITTTKTAERFIIRPKGRFDFTVRREFSEASKQGVDAGVPEVQVNLSEVDYMDSSALGMLLLFRERSLNAGRKPTLTGARDVVKQILDVANFQKLFGPL